MICFEERRAHILVNIGDYAGCIVHFIGIGGSSMNGLARLLRGRGALVRGSDSASSYITEALEREGIPVAIGHSAANVHGAALVVFTAAIAPDNVERMEAERLGIPQMERSVLLGQISASYAHSVAVSGTHGKTTTTAMIAGVLIDCGRDPSVHVGGQVDYIGGSVRAGGHELFVTEACEFARSFLTLSPTVSVILNIDADHLDCYRDIDEIQDTFLQFARRLPEDGLLVVNGDDMRCMQVARESGRRFVTFGLGRCCDYAAAGEQMDDEACFSYDLVVRGNTAARVSLALRGIHSVVDSLAAAACVMELGVSAEEFARSIPACRGAHRRFELTATVGGVKLYHDYGHNPSEYKTVVPIAAMLPHNRLYVVLQPHTYSRAKALIDDFGPSFIGADEVLVTDIYAAREKDPGDIDSHMLIERMQGFGYTTVYCPGFAQCRDYLFANWRPGDIVLTVGCGNINLLNDILRDEYTEKE